MAHSRAVVVITVLIAASVLGWWFGDQRRTANAQYRVVQVVDGDTIVVARGSTRDTNRLLGIDTPKSVKPHLDWDEDAGCYLHAYFARSTR